MSMVLLDGPAKGSYSTTRAPYFLRAVVDANGKADLLDQLVDFPHEDECVYVYQAEPGGHLFDPDMLARTGTFLCSRNGRAAAASGRYLHRGDVDGEQLRETAAWREWTRHEPTDRPLVDVTAPLPPRNAG
jgi:hypothetical protein